MAESPDTDFHAGFIHVKKRGMVGGLRLRIRARFTVAQEDVQSRGCIGEKGKIFRHSLRLNRNKPPFAGLETMGHEVKVRDRTWGNMHGVMWNLETGEVTAGSDSRWPSGRAIVK